MQKQITGKKGEQIAQNFLLQKGYTIIETNYNEPRWGEIDIIAIDKDELVFVEVRTKTSKSFGDPLESITSHKIKALQRSIGYYLKTKGKKYQTWPMRIDIVSVKIDQTKNSPILETVSVV